MLRIKIIKGPEAGKTFELPPGDHVIGRAPDCDIILNSPGVSKKHAKFSVQGNKCIITDLGSSNGTFVNGTKIHDRILRPGDRVGLHEIILELKVAEAPGHSATLGRPAQAWSQNVAFNQPILQVQESNPTPQLSMVDQAQAKPEPTTLLGLIESYVEKIILPGVYRLAELYPVSHVLAAFVAIFVLLVTSLSTIPMAALTREGVQKEAQRRALTIARQLATMSEKAIAMGAEGNIRTDLAEGEDGVVSALVVSQDDGHIIAPLAKAQGYTNDQFVALARKHETEPFFIEDLGSSNIGVAVPVHGFSQELGQQVVVADSIIIYKLDSQNWSSTVGLFARILIIALVVGGLLYFLLYRLITHHIVEATNDLDKALRGEKDSIQTKVDFDVFKKLIENVNSAIGRMGKSQSMVNPSVVVDRPSEASNLVRIISDPAFALDGENLFLQVNSAFEELIGMRLLTLQGQGLSILQDQALKLNLEDLLNNAKAQPGTIVTNHLAISGVDYEIDMQASPDAEKPEKINYAIATLKRRSA